MIKPGSILDSDEEVIEKISNRKLPDFVDSMASMTYKGTLKHKSELFSIQNPSIGDLYVINSGRETYVYTSNDWTCIGVSDSTLNFIPTKISPNFSYSVKDSSEFVI